MKTANEILQERREEKLDEASAEDKALAKDAMKLIQDLNALLHKHPKAKKGSLGKALIKAGNQMHSALEGY